VDWQLADAKNKLSEEVTRALTEGPQRIRRRGEVVVVLSEADYERPAGQRLTLRDFLLDGLDLSDWPLLR